MTKLTEDAIEQNLIDQLKKQGYQYFHGSTITPAGDNPVRSGFDSVVLEKQFKASLKKLNPELPESARVEAYQHVFHLGANDIMSNNAKFHQMLTDGVTVEYFKDGQSIGLQVKLIDFETPENNDFRAVNQFVVKENNQSKRLDVVLFVNGLPLVMIELKSAISEKATLDKAYTQIQNYKNAIPSIFNYNALCIISDGIDARVSSVSAPYSRFLAWKSPLQSENGVLPELQILAERMLEKEVLLKLIRFNTVFESEEIKDEKTGLLFLVKIKKVAAYHQYYVVEKAIKSTLRSYPEKADDTFEMLSMRGNIVVVADEAHRSQYGFTGKVNTKGNIKYGNAKYMRDALPNATYIGFTGTPIEKEDRDTQKVFGNYIDIYDIVQSVKDGATVRLSYESRLVKIKFNVVHQMFHGFEYKKYFETQTEEKLKILLASQNFILRNEKLKERFLSEVTTLSKLYVMAVPSDESETIKDQVAFFQAIKWGKNFLK